MRRLIGTAVDAGVGRHSAIRCAVNGMEQNGQVPSLEFLLDNCSTQPKATPTAAAGNQPAAQEAMPVTAPSQKAPSQKLPRTSAAPPAAVVSKSENSATIVAEGAEGKPRAQMDSVSTELVRVKLANKALEQQVSMLEEQLSALSASGEEEVPIGEFSSLLRQRSSGSFSPARAVQLLARSFTYAPIRAGALGSLRTDVVGVTPPLHIYKSHEQKEELLKAAISCGCADTLMAVILHLQGSMRAIYFTALVGQHERATLALASYYRKSKMHVKLHQLYCQLGHRRVMEAARICYQNVHKGHHAINGNASLLLSTLQDYLVKYDSDSAVSKSWMHQMAYEYGHLLERQIKIETHDSRIAQTGRDEFYNKHPRSCILNLPLASTVEYLALYHPKVPKDKLSSPQGTKDFFDMDQKLYFRHYLTGCVRGQAWDHIHDVLQHKSMFSKTVYKSPIPMDEVCEIIGINSGPQALVDLLIPHIADPARRVHAAFKWRSYETAIRALADLRWRHTLQATKEAVVDEMGATGGFALRELADEILSNTKLKWKSEAEEHQEREHECFSHVLLLVD